jgi:hypothetical protein
MPYLSGETPMDGDRVTYEGRVGTVSNVRTETTTPGMEWVMVTYDDGGAIANARADEFSLVSREAA